MADRIQSISELPVADITVESRIRPVSANGVAAIVASVRELGVIKDPIHVRKIRHRDDKLVLMAGAHRLEAARQLGWETIPATLWTCNDTWAQLMEVDDNLASAELTALDTAVFLARRKRIYEELHPETKQGAAGAAKRWDATELSSFASAAAEKMGISERQIRKIAAAGAALGVKEVQELRMAPKPVSLADLQLIGKISNTVERYDVCRLLSTGAAKSAAKARKAIADKDNPTPPKDPVEEAFQVLFKTWGRAPMAARRRFVHQIADDLAAMEGGSADV
ncbi:chromosome partitioning protein ParB [Ruegeria sediminis]|uniref:Chromosome partitioning protein ParB n=1 Tax=Ruegeria sediminis TaxID=2583820 RepID=A0ABY2X4W8_9RHOB|nr:ParB N-terminal domain-containing protein [Ruegeria sediminis]TMV09852.1 chromosome partitioning protein ParB [Ruegeria sediminis]